MPGTLSVPERWPRSCPPPSISGERRTRTGRRRTYSAPTPLGPYILWAESEARSTPSASTSKGIRPTDWAASQWKRTPAARVMRASSSMGWTTPVSLLACITETSTVSGRSAARSRSGSSRPSRSTSRSVTSKPSRSSARSESSTALCSVRQETRWRPLARWNRATPFSARLSDSVAPLVKTSSRAVAPTSRATSARAPSTASSARQPKAWLFEAALPNSKVK